MKKTATYDKPNILTLADDKPIVYRIQTQTGKDNYVGVAKRGRAADRIAEHLGEIPGSIVKITQHDSLADAMVAAQRIINRCQPKYNRKGRSKAHADLRDRPLGPRRGAVSRVLGFLSWPIRLLLDLAPAKLSAGENPPAPPERFRPDPPPAPPRI